MRDQTPLTQHYLCVSFYSNNCIPRKTKIKNMAKKTDDSVAEEKTTTKKAKKATKTTKKKAVVKTNEDGSEIVPVKKKRKTRKKATEIVKLKLYWGVYNHAMKLVAKYEFNQRKAAEQRSEELSPEGKPPHFVQKIKEEFVEVIEPESDVDAESNPETDVEVAAPAKRTRKSTKKA